VLPAQQPGMAAGESVDGVSLWHGVIVADETRGSSHPSGARLGA
jgi:hypothetical protein